MSEIVGNKPELETFIGLGGQLRYKCPNCGFDSYNQGQVLKHWLSTHSEKANSRGGATLFDADDKPLRKDLVVEQLPEALKKVYQGDK